MAEFSGKILSAVFANEESSIVKVRYEDGDVISIYNLEVNEDDKDYQDLISEGWDSERIAEETAEFKRAQSLAFNIEVETAAKKILEEKFGEDFGSTKDTSDSDGSISWENLLNLNEDKDEIFKFKIWAFESPAMKDATADSKRAFRKAPTLLKAIAIYDTML